MLFAFEFVKEDKFVRMLFAFEFVEEDSNMINCTRAILELLRGRIPPFIRAIYATFQFKEMFPHVYC